MQDFLDLLDSQDLREIPEDQDFPAAKVSQVSLDHLDSLDSLAVKEPLVLLVWKFLLNTYRLVYWMHESLEAILGRSL